MFTLGDLTTNVFSSLEQNPRYTSDLITIAANRAVGEIAKFVRYKDEIWQTMTQVGDDGLFLYEYDMAGVNSSEPGDWGGILEVKDVLCQNVPLLPITMSEFFHTQPDTQTVSTSPRHYAVRANRYLVISPRPSQVYSLKALIDRMPAKMTAAENVVECPDALQESVELYMKYHLLKDVPGEETRAAGYLNLYEKQIKRDKETMYLNRVFKPKRTKG